MVDWEMTLQRLFCSFKNLATPQALKVSRQILWSFLDLNEEII